jgi:ParB family chromosome partitioning protein
MPEEEKKRHLGRGLDFLLGGGGKEEVKLINIDRIKPSPFQPRRSFPQKSLMELVESIKSKGVIEPIIVRIAKDGFYELICGERRLRASKIAGLTKIPAIVKNVSDEEAFEIALIENIQRENLSPIEFALAFEKLVQRGYTHEDIAKKVGKSRAWVTNMTRILNLPSKVKKWIDEGKISLGHAKVLCSIPDKDKVVEIAEKIIKENINVRELENIARSMKSSSQSSDGIAKSIVQKISKIFPQSEVKIKEKNNSFEIKIIIRKDRVKKEEIEEENRD